MRIIPLKADKEDATMSMNGKLDVTRICTARSINEALRAYNRECETCLAHGCNGQYCQATRAMVNVTNRREFQTEMNNPMIREQVKLALEMG